MPSLQDVIPQYFAHEVYVLDDKAVTSDVNDHAINIWSALHNGQTWSLFVFFALVLGLLFALALFLKSTSSFKRLGRLIDRSTVFAPDIIRIAFAASLIFSASHAALYGPELPLNNIVGGKIILALLWVSGTALLVGLWSRVWATLMIAVWLWAFLTKGVYLLTYSNYLGEALAILLFPCQRLSIDFFITSKQKTKQLMRWSEFSMPVARLMFGLSLLYTAISIKFMDTSLPLDVVTTFQLTRYFQFEPLFVVLGAGLIEVMVSLLYVTGLLQRFTSIIFLIFMTMSLMFFKESVWPHYLLIALGIGIFMHKPDIWSLDRYLFVRKTNLPNRKSA